MKITYTQKLFYRKYAYKVILTCSLQGNRWYKLNNQGNPPQEFMDLTNWCDTHAANSYKIQRRYGGTSRKGYSTWYQHVYLSTQAQKDALVQAYGAQVQEICQPLDTDHLNILDSKNIVEVRKSLIYKKWSYAVYFKYQKNANLYEWLEALFKDSETSVLKGNPWWPTVYSTDILDVKQVEFSYLDDIKLVKTVKLITP